MDDGATLRPRVEALEAKVARAESAWRSTVWEGWRRLGWVLAMLLAVAAVGGLGWAAFFRGSAWGTAARANAEREALRWGRARWPTLTEAEVYCGGSWLGNCRVRAPNGQVFVVDCDDDVPAHNDGCYSAHIATSQEYPQ